MDKLRAFFQQISPLDEAALTALTSCFRPQTLTKGSCFVREGCQAHQVGFLERGVVRAYFLNKEGKEYNKQFFTGPSIIGAYTSLLTKQSNRIAQQALTDCHILVADYTDIENLFQQHHSIERLGRKIAEQLFLEKEQKELEMALLDADQRYRIFQEQFPNLEQEIAQYHIASYLSITATQLSRIRKKMHHF